MDTTPSPQHALSGRNPTLFNVVVQFADMDMLRALVLTSQSMYKTLQHCTFDHLTMVVLEAPILKEQQQIVYNGADPVPSDTFRIPLNNVTGTQDQISAFPDRCTFDAWQCSSGFGSDYRHNLTIPDYARNFMARAHSVELVAYRRRLGTRISTFFTTNARHLKYGQPTTLDGCTTCAESNVSANANMQYKLHLSCCPASHTSHHNPDDDDDERAHNNSGCIFSRHCSHEYFEGDGAESRLSRFRATPDFSSYSYSFPYEELPPLQLKFLHSSADIVFEEDKRTKRRRHIRDTVYRDGHFSIVASHHNTRVFRPRFQNLPLVEQHATTASLYIRIVDCVSFDADDWCNAIPGCTLQPVHTWTIHDDPSAPYHRHSQPDLPSSHDYMNTRHSNNRDEVNNHGHHFPSLTSLVLQYTCLDGANRCGIGEFDMVKHVCFSTPADLSHFFIDGDLIHLPHLQHFGVIGTLLEFEQFAYVIFHNTRVSSLYINPGPQSFRNTSTVMHWAHGLTDALDRLENYTTPPSSAVSDNIRHGDTTTNVVIHHEDDIERDNPRREPTPQPRDESMQRVETGESGHKPRPRRKYNFSFDIAKSYLESRCPHNGGTLTQRVPNRYTTDSNGLITPTLEDFSQFGQHRMTCAKMHDTLTLLYLAYRDYPENRLKSVLSESSDWSSLISAGFKYEHIITTIAISQLAQRVLTHLEMRCHHCLHTNPGCTMFPGASPGDCTATQLPPSADVPLSITDLPQDDEEARPGMPSVRPNKEMYMRLRKLLRIPPHVVLRL